MGEFLLRFVNLQHFGIVYLASLALAQEREAQCFPRPIARRLASRLDGGSAKTQVETGAWAVEMGDPSPLE